MKAFADRPRDWIDVEGIVARQMEALKWSQIERDLRPLAASKDDVDIGQRLLDLRRRLESNE